MGLSAGQAKILVLQAGYDAVGVARPHSDSLPAWVKSVLVGMHATLDDAFDYEMYIEYDGRRKWYKPVYTMLEALSARAAESLRAAGLRAMHLTFEDSLSLIDLRSAAVEAGLGVWGKNNLVITRRYGPRVRFGALFVDADWPADGPLLDYYCPSCTLCWGACPTNALGAGGYRREECIAEYNPTPDLAARQDALETRPSACTRLQCTACITACPIGSRLPVAFFRDVRPETP
jgi:epoxyqueuosine reductase